MERDAELIQLQEGFDEKRQMGIIFGKKIINWIFFGIFIVKIILIMDITFIDGYFFKNKF